MSEPRGGALSCTLNSDARRAEHTPAANADVLVVDDSDLTRKVRASAERRGARKQVWGSYTLRCLQVVARALARKRVTFALAVHGLEALEQLRGGARYK